MTDEHDYPIEQLCGQLREQLATVSLTLERSEEMLRASGATTHAGDCRRAASLLDNDVSDTIGEIYKKTDEFDGEHAAGVNVNFEEKNAALEVEIGLLRAELHKREAFDAWRQVKTGAPYLGQPRRLLMIGTGAYDSSNEEWKMTAVDLVFWQPTDGDFLSENRGGQAPGIRSARERTARARAAEKPEERPAP